MATKRLARTVIEGGRAHYNKFERNHSHRKRRARDRAVLHALLRDPESWAETALQPIDPVPKWFFDRLGVAQRWLRARVGQPWRDVEGMILRTFDTRSLAGRHIVFDHLLPTAWEASRSLELRWTVNRGWFFVDDRGLLRFDGRRIRSTRWSSPQGSCRDARRFVGERLVARIGSALYWLEPTRWPLECKRCDLPSAPDGLPRRQGRALGDGERARYLALGDAARQSVTVTFTL